MLSRVVRARVGASAARHGASAVSSCVSFSTDAKEPAKDKKQQRPRKQFQNSDKQQGGTERKFSFALKGGKKKSNDNGEASDKSASDKAQKQPRGKKFSFAPSVTAKDKEPELEHFDKPGYWMEDFPADFDDEMKHEVEKLEVFADFTMLMDSSWQKQIHPLFDGSDIELIVNVPLEDFDERLFIDDKSTYDTKVVMHVPLSCFSGLSKEGLEVVKQLAGPRYQDGKKMLKLTEDRYNTRVFNHKRLCDILRDLTQTAHELSAKTQASA
ncbi:hypothetical protein Poli38472_011424 [Pythium oligandrum]|uniref:Small ribosomal subunit protein mS35 mitochondrial conserved domain-containing protein n=1 Tax=Pythium oligandrum TaxID=41045 RepID=A0A8K1FKU0_PYTOL|nr:hypothetical protein Poli38472_011424 [Pythium oligandrum]|eukprot:TMW64544.1 hypothetical protein Poli38472_011424 [Pythium oligandrum]